MSVALSHPP